MYDFQNLSPVVQGINKTLTNSFALHPTHQNPFKLYLQNKPRAWSLYITASLDQTTTTVLQTTAEPSNQTPSIRLTSFVNCPYGGQCDSLTSKPLTALLCSGLSSSSHLCPGETGVQATSCTSSQSLSPSFPWFQPNSLSCCFLDLPSTLLLHYFFLSWFLFLVCSPLQHIPGSLPQHLLSGFV